MGHHITALIGIAPLIEQLAASALGVKPTSLPHGLAIAPLGHQQLDGLSGVRTKPSYDGFIYLGPELMNGVCRTAPSSKLLYIETDYFGGTGRQAAAFIDAGRLIWKDFEEHGRQDRPAGAKSPVSRGLSDLGVPKPLDGDEFQAVGLDRFRDNEALGLNEWDDDDE